MVAGGIPSPSAAWQAYAAFALAFLAPIAYMLVSIGQALFLVLGALAPVALVANLGASVQLDALARAHEEINASGRK